MVIFDGNVLNLMGSKQWSFPRLLQLSVSQLGNFLLHWSHEDSLPYYLIEALLFSFTFRFRIHLELIFVWSVKCYFIPLSIEISNIIVLLIKILSLFHCLIEPHLLNCVCVCVCVCVRIARLLGCLVWSLDLFVQTCVQIFDLSKSKSNYFDYCAFITNLDIK